jgi:hypothetical protein
MATTKKKPTTAKTTTTRKTTAKRPKITPIQSFRRYDDTTPFMTFKFTQQSLYWLILSVVVLALGAWVMYLNVQIQNLYDQVEMNAALSEHYTIPAPEKAPATPTTAQ